MLIMVYFWPKLTKLPILVLPEATHYLKMLFIFSITLSCIYRSEIKMNVTTYKNKKIRL